MSNVLRTVLLVCCLFCLTACGTRYGVIVDALNDGKSAAGTYLLLPKDETNADDLWFREVAASLVPAFESRGYRITDDRSQADFIAFINEGMEEPMVLTHTYMTAQSVPDGVFHDRRGRHRMSYATVYTPETVTRVIHAYNLEIASYARGTKNELGRQVWKIHLRCTGQTADYRRLLNNIRLVLPKVLGTHSHGLQRYDVIISRDGEVEVLPVR